MGNRNAPTNTSAVRLVSFVEGAFLEEGSDGDLVVASQWGDVRVDAPSPPLRSLLRRMRLGPVDPRNVLPPGSDPDPLLAALRDLGGCVVHSLTDGSGSGALLSVEPVAARGRFRLPERTGDPPVRLSPLAVSRPVGGGMLVESPLSLHRVLLHRPEAARLVAELAQTTTVDRISAVLPELGPGVVDAAIAYLVAVGMVGDGPAPGGVPPALEGTKEPLAPWSPYDLLFHNHRRPGRNGSTLVAAPTRPEDPPTPPRRVPFPSVPRGSTRSRALTGSSTPPTWVACSVGGPGTPTVPAPSARHRAWSCT